MILPKDRVVPQEGQGIPVVDLIKHTVKLLLSLIK